MQQYSSLPEQNSQVDATPTLLTTIQQLRAELWMERSLNQLQCHLNECLIEKGEKNLLSIEAEIFQTVVNELDGALHPSRVAIALTQIGEITCKVSYISSKVSSLKLLPALVTLKTGKKLHLNLEQVIDIEDLQQLEESEHQCAFPIAAGSSDILGWLIIAPDPNYSNDEKPENTNLILRTQLIEGAIERCIVTLTQLRHLQSLQQVCHHLESFNQELQRTNEVKNQFLANTSHEIRTPLSSILGFTHLLLAQGFEPDRERHQEYLNIIQSSGKHLLALINDILDLSKIEANQMEIQWETVDLPALCRTVFALIKEKAATKGLQLRLELDSDVTTLTVDSLRLKQMLLNLLFNALKFTEKGSVGLQVKQHKDFVNFVVWDTGTGIPKEHLGELFQPYSQIANALVSRDEGTGLGLAVTRKLAELHSGYVEVESEIGQGSRFTIVLPLNPCTEINGFRESQEVEKIGQPLIASPIPSNILSSNSPQILLVEDDLPNAQLMQTYLGKLGYQVTWVKSATQMWQALQQQSPTLILMDVYLPDGNGLNLVKQLRQHQEYEKIPVIAQTGMAMKGDCEVCIAAGVDDYICKPIDLELLASLVSKYCQVVKVL